jgi:hypothetical protein
MGWRRPWESEGVEVIGWRDYPSLLGISLSKQGAYACGMARYSLLRLLHRSVGGLVPDLPKPPDTDWVKAARFVARKVLVDESWELHSERTWLFASALAMRDERAGKLTAADSKQLDPELLYVASMLHDTGLFVEDRTRCFAITGARFAFTTARQAHADEHRAEVVYRAIASHISLCPGNVLGKYLQFGSLLDVTGNRIWDLDRAVVDQVCGVRSRADFPAQVRHRWAEECSMFPNGRAGFARCPGAISIATYLAPLPH